MTCRVSADARPALLLAAVTAPWPPSKPAPAQPPSARSGPTKGPAQVGAAADGAGDHRQRPAHPAVPVRRRLDDGAEGRRARQLQGDDYIAPEFKRLGLKPAGDDGGLLPGARLRPDADSTAATARLAIAGGAALRGKQRVVPSGADRHQRRGAPTPTSRTWPRCSPADWAIQRGARSGALSAARWPCSSARRDRRRSGGFAEAGGGAGAGAGAANACDADGRLARTSAAPPIACAGGRGPAAGGGRGGRGGGRGGSARPRLAGLNAAGVAAVLLVEDDHRRPRRRVPGRARDVPRAARRRHRRRRRSPQRCREATLRQAARPGSPSAPVGAPVTRQLELPVWHMSPHAGAQRDRDPARVPIPPAPASTCCVSAHNDHNGILAVAVDHDSLRAYNTIMRPQGANDGTTCRPNAAAAVPDRFADRAGAQHPAAAPRLDHERRRRRRLGHGRAAGDRRAVRHGTSGAVDHLRLAHRRGSRTARLEVVHRPSRPFRSTRSPRRSTWTWSARDA